MPDPIELETERLRLRTWRDSDREPFAAMNADPQVMEFFESVMSREKSDASVARMIDHFAMHGWGLWVGERRDTGEFIGTIGLTTPRWPLPGAPKIEIGWRLAKAHWGLGFASEGAGAALRLGFERLDATEIVAVTALGNRRSRAVMERIGMRDAREDFDHPAVPEGHPVRRHCLHRITREDWLSARR